MRQSEDWEKHITCVSFAIDFDGTVIDVEGGYPNIGREREEAIDVLLEMKKAGHKLVLWTCRNGPELQDAIIWCRSRNLEFDAVCDNLDSVKTNYGDPRKIVATYYVDDRNAPHGFPGWRLFRDWLVENNYL